MTTADLIEATPSFAAIIIASLFSQKRLTDKRIREHATSRQIDPQYISDVAGGAGAIYGFIVSLTLAAATVIVNLTKLTTHQMTIGLMVIALLLPILVGYVVIITQLAPSDVMRQGPRVLEWVGIKYATIFQVVGFVLNALLVLFVLFW